MSQENPYVDKDGYTHRFLPSVKPKGLGVPTDRQLSILMYIIDYRRRVGYSPGFREISGEFGYASANTVMCHIKALERKGLLRRAGSRTGRANRVARGILPTVEFISAEQLENSNSGDLAAGE